MATLLTFHSVADNEKPWLKLCVFEESMKRNKILIVGYIYTKTSGNGDRTDWSPIRSARNHTCGNTESDDRVAGVRFVYHEYDYRSNWTTRGLITN